MATNFLELATTLKYLEGKLFLDKKANFTPWYSTAFIPNITMSNVLFSCNIKSLTSYGNNLLVNNYSIHMPFLVCLDSTLGSFGLDMCILAQLHVHLTDLKIMAI